MNTRHLSQIYQVKVTLEGIHPPIWRRVLLSDRITLLDLHDIIQALFTWEDYHLHEFRIQGVKYGDPANDEFGEQDIHDESRVKLSSLDLRERSRITYEYDFGDGWEHSLLVEKILPMEKGMKLPQCIKGKRAGPPEDVGGIWGYAGFLEAIGNPEHEDHDSSLEWIGGEYNSEAFDLQEINQRLSRVGRRGWGGRLPVDEELAQPPYFDPNRWEQGLTEEIENSAQALALRKDVVALLTYFRDNKVTGTQSTGNLPLKTVQEVAARFVGPPVLEEKFGDRVFRFRSEEDIWPVYFAHVLAQQAGLVSGGPGRRWLLTPRGEAFLELPPAGQVWILWNTWWYQTNWLIAYPIAIFGDYLPENLPPSILTLLREAKIGEPVPFEAFADRLVKMIGWTWEKKEPDYVQMNVYSGIQRMVVDQLEDFGLLQTKREKDPKSLLVITILKSFSLTGFGRYLIDKIGS